MLKVVQNVLDFKLAGPFDCVEISIFYLKVTKLFAWTVLRTAEFTGRLLFLLIERHIVADQDLNCTVDYLVVLFAWLQVPLSFVHVTIVCQQLAFGLQDRNLGVECFHSGNGSVHTVNYLFLPLVFVIVRV